MAQSMNKLIVIGRLGRDPEEKQTKTGSSYWTFSVATNEWNGKEKEEETTWHNVTCWDEYHGKTLMEKISKGSIVYIEGTLKINTYMKDGVEMKAANLVMNKFSSSMVVMDKGDTKKPAVTSDSFDDDVPF
jgi:single-strand DNA-binding protein|tara:strand:+ start:463 stop:855 length:393 start_codon:yes stop_codon:yes gene_type:complete